MPPPFLLSAMLLYMYTWLYRMYPGCFFVRVSGIDIHSVKTKWGVCMDSYRVQVNRDMHVG